jgi:hypothetical protein
MNRLLAQSLQIPWGTGDTKTITGNLDTSTFSGGKITLGSIISKTLSYIFIFAGIGLLLMLLGSGFAFLTSAGDPKKMEKAKSQLTNALVGFLIIFVAFWLVQAAGYIFGFQAIGAIFGK